MSDSSHFDSNSIQKEDTKEWWRHAVIYQIYPRSYRDTNSDGIGDLQGIIEKLDYIENLGVDAIWISPFYPSPMKDFGYDVSNYRDIDPIFGTRADFKTLLDAAHARGIKIIIDLVLSHTSNQHPWFNDPSKKNWYVWADAKKDKNGNRIPPNNWTSVFGGSAWEWDQRYGQYYLHNFLIEQPDLNFHNPSVRVEILDICKYWLDMGVDGFRLDTVNFYYHSIELQNNPLREAGTNYATQFEKDVPYSRVHHIHDKSQPENITFIEDLRTLTNRYENIVLIGEIGDDEPYARSLEYTKGNHRLHTCYNTHMMSGTQKRLNNSMIIEPLLKTFVKNHPKIKQKPYIINLKNTDRGWPTWAFSNHDVVRAASRWSTLYGHDPRLSKCLIALLGCLPGTLCLYQGEELGLPEGQIPFGDLQDPWAKETWPEWQGRDGCRTPMVWNGKEKYSGFSDKKPWLPIPETHKTMDVQAQTEHKYSTLNFTKKFLKWRKMNITKFQQTLVINRLEYSDIVDFTYHTKNNDTKCIFNLSDQELNHNGLNLKPYGLFITGFTQNNPGHSNDPLPTLDPNDH